LLPGLNLWSLRRAALVPGLGLGPLLRLEPVERTVLRPGPAPLPLDRPDQLCWDSLKRMAFAFGTGSIA